jgi:HK97 gp10 family phage protein
MKGLDKLNGKLNQLQKMMQDKIFLALESSANTIRTNAIKSIQAAPSGADYVRYKNGNKRIGKASAAGAPPHTDTGNLVNSIQVQRRQDSVVVGSMESAPYGKWLEYGTSKMSARPWLRPAFEESKKIVDAKLQRAGIQVIDRVT